MSTQYHVSDELVNFVLTQRRVREEIRGEIMDYAVELAAFERRAGRGELVLVDADGKWNKVYSNHILEVLKHNVWFAEQFLQMLQCELLNVLAANGEALHCGPFVTMWNRDGAVMIERQPFEMDAETDRPCDAPTAPGAS